MSDVPQDPDLETLPSLAEIQALRSQLGNDLLPAQAIAIWDLGAQRSTLLISEGDVGHPTPVLHHMQIGTGLLAQRTFKKSMPSAVQLEQAIMLVEDAIMPLARLLPLHTVLLTQDPLLVNVAHHAMGMHDAPTAGVWALLHREAVEQLFQQLVHQAELPLLPQPGLPQSPQWAAALLLLREALHHWQVHSIWVAMAGATPHPKAAA